MLNEQIEQNRLLSEELSKLRHQLATLQAMLFGKKSERSSKSGSQLDNKQDSTGKSDKNLTKETTGNGGRKPLPETLERHKIRHDIPKEEQVCACCHGHLHCIGKEVTEQLDYTPAKLIVKKHLRYKYGCRHCKSYVLTATMPEQPIDKGLAGSGLLAEIIVNKYQDALPLYRQQKRWERLGYELPRSTLCDWVMQCALRLKPIVLAMKEQCLMKAHKLHTDDTRFPIQAKDKVHKGVLWVYVANAENAPACTIYEYSKTRAQIYPMKFLKGYRGYLQADAYPGYNKLYADGDIIEVACWAHTRRKFKDIAKSVDDPTLANEAVDYIGQLYAIEEWGKQMTKKQRYYYRKRFARPILKAFKKWLHKQRQVVPPKSPLGEAMQYATNHWKALNHYLLDGELSIDNNAAERAIKPFVIGRKNFLFAGSHQGAEHAAVIYSLIESCKMHEINTFDYFKDVLERLPTTLNNNISELFPCYWMPKHSE